MFQAVLKSKKKNLLQAVNNGCCKEVSIDAAGVDVLTGWRFYTKKLFKNGSEGFSRWATCFADYIFSFPPNYTTLNKKFSSTLQLAKKGNA